MKEFNLQNYISKIFILLINDSKLKITNNSLINFFKTFEINTSNIPKDFLSSYIKYDIFLKIINILIKKEILNDMKIIKIYKDLSYKLDFIKFKSDKNNFKVNSNINNIIKKNKTFFENLIKNIDLQINEINYKTNKLISYNFNKLVKIFEFLFISPELIDLKNLLLLFIKSLEKNVFILNNSNQIVFVDKFKKNDKTNFNIDVLINFLIIVSKFISFKYNKFYPILKKDSKNFNYLIFYIHYSIEKFIVI